MSKEDTDRLMRRCQPGSSPLSPPEIDDILVNHQYIYRAYARVNRMVERSRSWWEEPPAVREACEALATALGRSVTDDRDITDAERRSVLG